MSRRNSWRSIEARRLSASVGLEDAEAAMNLLVDELLRSADQTVCPTNLEIVSSFRGVIEIRRWPMNDAGMIIPAARGLVIAVRYDDSPGRQNFSICHEICHTLFPGGEGKVLATVDRETGVFSKTDEVEYLCDVGASRMLLPPVLVREKGGAADAGIASLIGIAEEFGASIEATAMALTKLEVWQAAVVVFEERTKPSEEWLTNQLSLPDMEVSMGVRPELRVRMSCVPRSVGVFFPRHKSVRRDGTIYAALEGGGWTNGREIMDLPLGEVVFDAESRYMPYRRDGMMVHRVISVLKLVEGGV